MFGRKLEKGAMMGEASETVLRFFNAWDPPGSPDAAVREFFMPDTVWENVGMAKTTGVDEAVALNAELTRQFGMATIRFEMLAMAETGNSVLTERIDHIVDAGGKVAASFAVAGILEVRDGRIAAWRDYFDTAGLLGGG